MNILEALNKGSLKLKRNNIINFQLDSEILLSETIQKDRKYLILNHDRKPVSYTHLRAHETV